MRGFCWLFIRHTCPIQRHLRLLICSLMVQVLARRTCVGMCPVLLQSSLSFSIHKVALLRMTSDLKIVILALLVSCPLLQVLASLFTDAPVAFPMRFLMSSTALHAWLFLLLDNQSCSRPLLPAYLLQLRCCCLR